VVQSLRIPLLSLLLLCISGVALVAQQLPRDRRLSPQGIPRYLYPDSLHEAIRIGGTTLAVWSTALDSGTQRVNVQATLVAQAIRDGMPVGTPTVISDAASLPGAGVALRALGTRFLVLWGDQTTTFVRILDTNGVPSGPVIRSSSIGLVPLAGSRLDVVPGDSSGPMLLFLPSLFGPISLLSVDTVRGQLNVVQRTTEPFFDDTVAVRPGGPQLERFSTGWRLRYPDGTLDSREIPLSRLDGNLGLRVEDDTSLVRMYCTIHGVTLQFYTSVFDSLPRESAFYSLPPSSEGWSTTPVRVAIGRDTSGRYISFLCETYSVYAGNSKAYYNLRTRRFMITAADTVTILDTVAHQEQLLHYFDAWSIAGTITDGFGCRVRSVVGGDVITTYLSSRGEREADTVLNRWYEEARTRRYPYVVCPTTRLSAIGSSRISVLADSAAPPVQLSFRLDPLLQDVAEYAPVLSLWRDTLLLAWQETRAQRQVQLWGLGIGADSAIQAISTVYISADRSSENRVSPVEYSTATWTFSGATLAVPGTAWMTQRTDYFSHGYAHAQDIYDARTDVSGSMASPRGWLPVIGLSSTSYGYRVMSPVVSGSPQPNTGSCAIAALLWGGANGAGGSKAVKFNEDGTGWMWDAGRLNLAGLSGVVMLDSQRVLFVWPDHAQHATGVDGIGPRYSLVPRRHEKALCFIAQGYGESWLRLHGGDGEWRLERYGWPATLLDSGTVYGKGTPRLIFHPASQSIGLLWSSLHGVRLSLFDCRLRLLADTVVNGDTTVAVEAPSGVFRGDTLYSVWEDVRDGTREIYTNYWVLPREVREAAERASDVPRGEPGNSSALAVRSMQKISVTPQPVRAEMVVEFVAPHSGEGVLELIDSWGEVVLSVPLAAMERGKRMQYGVETGGLRSQVYQLRVRIGQRVVACGRTAIVP